MSAAGSARTLTSPLARWPGSVTLPAPDLFDGRMWDAWRDGVERRKDESANRTYCYAGLALVKRFGGWQIAEVTTDDDGERVETPLALETVQSWENHPEDERIRLISWLGRSFYLYVMVDVLDPKD